MKKITLNQKILSGFIVCTIILLIISILSFRNSEKVIDSNQWVNHTYEVLNEFEKILLSSVYIQSGTRGFVITGKDDFLEPYDIGISQITSTLDNVQKLTIDNSEEQKNIEEIKKQAKLLIKFNSEIIEIRKKDFEKAKELVFLGTGKELGDELRRLISNSKDMEKKLLEERRIINEKDTQNFNILFIFMLLVIAIVLISVYMIIMANLSALKKAEQESSNKNWLLSGNFEMNERTRGEKEVNELSQSIIEQLCTYLKAQIGVIYLFENGQLNLAGSYAFNYRKQNTSVIKLGEGLVGQAALEKKTIIFTEIPDDYIKINSGLGNIIPKNIIMLPLLQDGVLKGIIEIGAVRSFSELDIEFLNIIGENVAIVINAAQSRTKLKELLEETQRQAEELEAQQEELRQSNEELIEKTSLLERSETELKTQQEELQQTNEELEEKANLLEEQKDKLENAKMDIETKARELEVTSKYKSEFLANMSHELRTPLNSILILSQLLSENKNNVLGEKDIEFSKNIYNSGTDLLNLINEILDLSKVESGKTELDIEEVSFNEINADINSMFSEIAKNKSIDFEIIFDENLLKSFFTDKQRLEQILRNLLSNAFKFTDKNGKVTMSIDKLNSNISFKNKKLNNRTDLISFSVTDTGIGILQEKQAIIFEAFQQADGSTKRKYGGTGLGLSISRELANALGGEIHLDSEEGKGSTFTLFIPLKFDESFVNDSNPNIIVKENKLEVFSQKIKNDILPQQTKAEKLPISNEEVNDDRYNIKENDKIILIMEDDIDFSKILLDFVRVRNYKAILATQGNVGLSYARYYKPDAIILDINLPVIDGVEILKHLKNNPDLRHIPVQIISGYDKRKEGLELGAFSFIQKPISKDDLNSTFDKIEEFISKKLKKLLVVEDNETQNKAIRELIGNGDVKSFSAYSGKESFEMLSKDNFDCVIVDLGLPDMSGYDLLEKIKTDEKLKKIPIIVYT
ncbi:MAG: response regulator, partial [Cyanobacteriota bacterium]